MTGVRSISISDVQIKILREQIKKKKQRLFSNLDRKTDYASLLKRHSRQVDALLKSLWDERLEATQATLIAVGGYGRSALFPFSDVDLLILIPDATNKKSESVIASFVSLLWDVGLDV